VGKSCLLLRFSDGSFTTSFITTIGWVDYWPQEIESFLTNDDLLLTAVPTAKGQALADDYGIEFFETVSKQMMSLFIKVPFFFFKMKWEANYVIFVQSAKTNLNVEQVFFSIAKDIKQRLSDTDSKAEVMCYKLFECFFNASWIHQSTFLFLFFFFCEMDMHGWLLFPRIEHILGVLMIRVVGYSSLVAEKYYQLNARLTSFSYASYLKLVSGLELEID